MSNFAIDHRIAGSAEVRPVNVMAHRSGRGGYVENLVVAFLFIINAENDDFSQHIADYVTRETYNQTKYNMDTKRKEMSVTLKEYCETSQSEFAKALEGALTKCIFVDSNRITFVEHLSHVSATITVPYFLSMVEFKFLIEAFSGYYWRVDAAKDGYSLQVIVSLKTDVL